MSTRSAYRDVAVFFLRVGVALVFERVEGGDDAGARVGGFNDGIDVAALGRHEGIGKAFAEFGNFLLAESFALGFGSLRQFAFVNNIYGAFRAHDGDFSRGPREIGVRANVFARHDAVRPAVGFARDDSDFRDGGFGKGEEQLGAVPDDAAELLLRARQKAGYILKSNQRNIERVAEAHEARTLHGSIDIENSS